VARREVTKEVPKP